MDEREALLKKSWEGEVLGEALFVCLQDLLPEDRHLWTLLSVLEHTVGAMVAPVGVAHGVEIDEDAQRRAGAELAGAVQAGGRDQLLRSALEVVGEYVPLYERLRELLPEDDKWLGDELVTHERAFERLLEDALSDRPDAGAEVRAFLARHGAAVPG
jgi:hypothetical protein